MPDLMSPLKAALSHLLAAAHTAFSTLGLDPAAGLTWVLAILMLVAFVRVATLPLVAHSIRMARRAALARPHLIALQRRFGDRRDLASLRELRSEQQRIRREHRLTSFALAPALVQIPVLLALYSVLSEVANRHPIGAMDATLVASLGSASLLGVNLAQRWTGAWAASPWQALTVLALALASAGLSYATQRWFTLPNLVLDDLPAQLSGVYRLMPGLSALGALLAAAVVPVGVLVYWLATNAWTLGQQAVICRWFPTPGSPAAQAQQARHRRA